MNNFFIEINNPSKCTGCYNCVKSCYPKAIKIDTDSSTVTINTDLCNECGFCTKVCNSDILEFSSSLKEIQNLLKSKKKVHIILDSIYQSDFPNITFSQMEQALLKTGFTQVHSNFNGFAIHDYITKDHFKKTKKTVIKTFCTPFIDYVQKNHSNLIKYLSPANTPENITSRLIKEEFGLDVITVYISTCSSNLSKRTKYDCDIHILTSDIIELFKMQKIDPNSFKSNNKKLKAFKVYDENTESLYTMEECVEALEALENGSKINQIIVPFWCNGCFGSPALKNNFSNIERKLLYKKYKEDTYIFEELTDTNIKIFGDLSRFNTKFQNKELKTTTFTDTEISLALESFGRCTEEETFNCGACGYSTCEELAIAVLNNMASPEQCTPNLSKKLKTAVDDLDKAYTELDSAFALTIPNSKLEIKLKNTREYKDIYIRETGKIKITGIIHDGGYRHVVNALKVAADLHSKGVMSVIGFDKDTLVKTIIFHDIGKSQPNLNVGQEVTPNHFFENGKLHADRSAELALANYKNEGINEDIYLLIKYHHHNENELPNDFPEHLLPMYRLFRIIDGISAGLTRRSSIVHFDLVGSTLYIKEFSQHPKYRSFYSIDLYKPEYLKKQYDFDDDLNVILYTDKYKK